MGGPVDWSFKITGGPVRAKGQDNQRSHCRFPGPVFPTVFPNHPSSPAPSRSYTSDWPWKHLKIYIITILIANILAKRNNTFSNSYGLTRLSVCDRDMPWSNFISIDAQTKFIRNVDIFTVSENAIFAKIRNLVQKCLKRWLEMKVKRWT